MVSLFRKFRKKEKEELQIDYELVERIAPVGGLHLRMKNM